MSAHAGSTRLWCGRTPLTLAAALTAVFAASSPAQQLASPTPPAPQASPQAAQGATHAREADDLSAVLGRLTSADFPRLPAASVFVRGDRTVAAADRVMGTVATSHGTLHVYGYVDGDVVTYTGDIIVHNTGTVAGNAIAIGGRVQVDGGAVTGQTLMLSGGLDALPLSTEDRSIANRLGLVGGWFAVLLLVAVGVVVFVSDNLDAVAGALERRCGAALAAGVGGQLAAVPVLVALTIALILTVLGILLVPFAVVVYVIVCAGLMMLGFLATAVVIGRGWRPPAPGSGRVMRTATLRAIVVGLLVLLSPWIVAALLAPWPAAATLARGVAFAVNWVACTAGLGAALISRAGIHRSSARPAQRETRPGWQTPTPVTGVVAVRHPSSSSSPVT